MKITGVYSIALLFLLFATASAAERGRTELGKWWKDSEVVRELQLSEAQVDRIEGIFLDFRPALANLNTELKNREDGLRALMNAEHLEEVKIKGQTELIARSRAALEKANSSMMFAIRKELSKEQWDKLQAIRELRGGSRIAPALPVYRGSPGTRPRQEGEKIYKVGEGIRAPMVLFQPLPSYTDEARAARVEGIVLLQAVIRKDGRATDVKVLRGIGYGLDQKAVDIITTEWRFEPGTMNGQPVDIQANIEVSFRLY